MFHQHILVRVTTAVSAILFLSIVTGCSKPEARTATRTAPGTPIQTASPPQLKIASELDDLSAFRSTVMDIASLVDKDDLVAVKTRIKDLEVSWDVAEAGLKSRATNDWHVLDRAVDRALAALCAGTPKQPNYKTVLIDLLETFDMLQGRI